MCDGVARGPSAEQSWYQNQTGKPWKYAGQTHPATTLKIWNLHQPSDAWQAFSRPGLPGAITNLALLTAEALPTRNLFFTSPLESPPEDKHNS